MTVCVTTLQLMFHPSDKVSVKFVAMTWPISIHLPQSDFTDSLKHIITDAINKIKNIEKPCLNKAISSFAVTNSATKYDQELVDSALNYMVWHNIIKNHPNSKSDPYLVNSKINPFVHNATYL